MNNNSWKKCFWFKEKYLISELLYYFGKTLNQEIKKYIVNEFIKNGCIKCNNIKYVNDYPEIYECDHINRKGKINTISRMKISHKYTVLQLYEELKKIELSNDIGTTVRRFVDAYLGFVGNNPNNWKVIFDHVWPQEYPLPQWYIDKIHRLLTLLGDALAPLFPPGQEDKSYHAAVLIWSGLHGIQSLLSDGKLGLITSESAHDLSSAMVGTIVVGLQDQIGNSRPE